MYNDIPRKKKKTKMVKVQNFWVPTWSMLAEKRLRLADLPASQGRLRLALQ